MPVVVVVPVERQRPLGAEAEQRAILRRRRDHGGGALAADVAVEADHPVRRRHHHVQVVADHQHAAAELAADLLDQPVEARLARLVEPLRRLVEDEEPRPPQQRLRQQRPLELAARERRELPPAEVRDPHPLQRLRPQTRVALGEPEEAVDGHRQRRIHGELLRHVADPEPRGADHPPRVRPLGADQQAQERALPRAVRPDHRHDLAGLEREVHALEHPVPAEGHPQAPGFDERASRAASLPASRQRAQSPSASIDRPLDGEAGRRRRLHERAGGPRAAASRRPGGRRGR